MFVPVHDINPLKHMPFQWMTVLLIALNILCYLLFGTSYFSPVDEYAVDLALVPQEVLAGGGTSSVYIFRTSEPLDLPEWMTLFTYMFVHVNFLHLAGNMTFLWVFGDNVEDAMGRWRFLLFYILCGVTAACAHVAVLPNSDTPVIGASGAIAGIIAAYLLLHPNVKIWVLVLYRIPLRITAAVAVGAWVAAQFYYAFVDDTATVAWGAHLAGFAAGALLIYFMRRPGVELFDRTVSKV